MAQLTYHHVGIPTDRPLPPEDYNERYRCYASGYFESPYGVEWMKYDPDCPLPELIKTVPHVAFIVDHGAPIEFLQFDRPESEIWPHTAKCSPK